MMGEYSCYKVGDQVIPPCGDGVRFDLTSGGAVLMIQMGKPTSKEKNDFKNGVPQFSLTVVDDIIFFLCRFGTGPWMEAPYNRYLSKPFDLSVPQNANEGIGIHAMLIDASTGVLVAQKIIGLEHSLSVKLLEAVAVQPEIPDYDRRLQRVFATMSTQQILEVGRK